MKITPSYLYLSLLLCLLSYAPLDAQEAFNDSVALIKRNYINATVGKDKGKEVLLRQLSTIPPEKEASDQNVIELQQLYPISPKEIKHLINTLHTDGSWEDINYADTKRSGWEPKKHTERILKLTKYHYQKKQILKPSERARLTNAIHQAMNFWFSRKLVCKNWWYNQIGIPRTLGPAFLLFEQEMSEPEKQGAIKVMMNSSFGMTGQNKVWLAGNVLIRALLQNDWQLAKEARKVIASEITLGQKEGIKADWSFHQHGPQQQQAGKERRAAQRALVVQRQQDAHGERREHAHHDQQDAHGEPRTGKRMQVEQRVLQRELAPGEQGQQHCARRQRDDGGAGVVGDLAQAVQKRGQPERAQHHAERVDGDADRRRTAADAEEADRKQRGGHGERDDEHRAPPELREREARDRGADGKPHGDDAAVQCKARAAHLRRRVRHDDARHRREEQARAHRLHEAAGEQHGEVLRNQRERASERKRPRPDEEHAAQPETAQHERRQHDGRRGNHHVPDDHPVRDGERDAEALRQLGQGDVHHALPERGREGARQQHGQHAGRAFPELARLSHPTAFPRSRTRPPPALASGRSIQCSDAVEAGSPAFRTRNAPVAKPMHGRRGAALASPLGFFR